eukprot:TRINITY_DN98242_c0_g1_i1.p1 TRINITY_DN98242_c0_g1~~TRINITY_DN98242_c0_g1_i1.p1  ORF type:complete len:365 (+),score=98.36 TRINITY_DN98242_c0_g1_i1:78-1172(+)
MPADLDMTLDDMIESTWEPGKGKGKGRGKGKGFSKGRGAGKSSRPSLDMSLDEIVDVSYDKGNGKSKGKGKDWDSWDNGRSWDKGYGKSSGKGFKDYDSWGSKGSGKSKGGNGSSGTPYWMEHDLRGDDEEEAPKSFKGAGKASGSWSRDDSKGWGKGKGSYGGSYGASYGGSYGGGYGSFGKGFGKGSGSDGIWTRSVMSSRASEGRGYAVGASSNGWRRVEDVEPSRPTRRGSALAAVAEAAVTSRRAAEKRARPVTRRRDDDDDDDDDDEDARPPPRARARTAAKPARSAPNKVKVTNIPRSLKAADVREAFEAETGKITLCELSKGTCFITFAKPKDAQKAVETFDRGELNGQLITVELD